MATARALEQIVLAARGCRRSAPRVRVPVPRREKSGSAGHRRANPARWRNRRSTPPRSRQSCCCRRSCQWPPPTDSISVAICSAVRRWRALEQRLGQQLGDAVVRRSVSASTPPLNAARNSTNGSRWSSFTSRRRPFGSSNFLNRLVAVRFNSRCSFGRAAARAAARKACGFPRVRYSRATRWTSAGVTRLTAAR